MELRNLRVSILTEFYPPDYAATGQLIEEIAIELGKLGIFVKVFTGQPGYAFEKSSAPVIESSRNLTVQRSRSSRMWHSRIRGKGVNGILFFLRSILYLIKNSDRGDVLLLTTAPPFLPILGYLARYVFGIRYVCLLYDIYPDIAVELQVVPAKHPLARIWDWLNQQTWKSAERVIVLNSSMRDRIVKKCPAIEGKISVIHNWANPERIVPIPKDENWFAREHALTDKFTVLYSGNLGRCHEVDTILDAATQLQGEAIQFVFVGNGAKWHTAIERVRDLGLQNCTFLPYQDKENLPYSLTACDLSLITIAAGMEGLVVPSKLYGMLAAGRPVVAICESHSYLKPLISKAQCGAAFEIGNSNGLAEFIRYLSRDRETAEKMGMSGRAYLMGHFTPEIIAKKYSVILQAAALRNYRQSKRARLKVFLESHKVMRRSRSQTPSSQEIKTVLQTGGGKRKQGTPR
jgi:glycosyltransferase involved in cell wall biosynthesis